MITFIEAEVALPDALWDEWLAAFVDSQGQQRLLTSWGDIQPTKEQWRRATRTMRDCGCKIAVMTESKPTAALAKAASWAGADMQAFRWDQLYEACMFLGMDGPQRTLVRTTATTLRDCFGAVDGAAKPAAPVALSRPTMTPTPVKRPLASSAPTPRPTANSNPHPAPETQRATPMRPATGTASPSRPTTGTASPRSSGPSRTPMADAASQNLAQVRQTSEEIQAKLAEVQARLRNRTRT